MTDTLAPAWQLWVAERLLLGDAVESIVDALVGEGLDAVRARREVVALAAEPGTQAARPYGLAAALRARTRRLATRVDVRPDLDVDTLVGVYVAHGVPVLAPGFCAGWPALARWTPEAWRARLGDAEVAVVLDADTPTRDRDFQRHTRRVPFRAYVDHVESAAPGNGAYMLANHHNVDGPLAPLLDDVTPPVGLLAPTWRTGGASLWYGPAGTHTPTHHDTTNVVFCQVRGRKRLWLAPPDEARLAAARDGYYSPIRLSDPGVTGPDGALAGGCVLTVDVAPGDMVLIPAGWWHEVLALDVSVSLGLVGLAFPNRYDGFRPGFGGGRVTDR